VHLKKAGNKTLGKKGPAGRAEVKKYLGRKEVKEKKPGNLTSGKTKKKNRRHVGRRGNVVDGR